MKESRESTLSEINKSIDNKTQKVTEDKKIRSGQDGLRSSIASGMSDESAKSKSAKKRKKDVKQVRKNLNEKMPKQLRDSNEIPLELDENNAVRLEEIEQVFDEAAADTGRAALYYKVRDAIKLYREAQDNETKMRMLMAVRESAFNYLLEKKGSAPERKRICSRIVQMVDSYAQSNEISTERNLDYLIGDEKISDKVLDMEILLAGKLTKKSSDPFEGDLAERRKNFKRKIKDVKLARSIKSDLDHNRQWAIARMNGIKDKYVVDENLRNEGYDAAVGNIVASYMNLDKVNAKLAGGIPDNPEEDLSTEDKQKLLGTNMLIRLSASDGSSSEKLTAKAHMIEGILADILSWNPKDFAFKEPGNFLNRTAPGQTKSAYFQELYNKLQIAENADVLLDELGQLEWISDYTSKLGAPVIKEAKARISLYKEISKEYANRLQLMNSPYYALLLQEDTGDCDTEGKLKNLAKPKTIAGIAGKKSVGETFKGYLRSLLGKNRRLKYGKRSGGEFTRNTDPDTLLKWHRKKNGAPASLNNTRMRTALALVDQNLDQDNEVLKDNWEFKNLIGVQNIVNQNNEPDLDEKEDQEQKQINEQFIDQKLEENNGQGKNQKLIQKENDNLKQEDNLEQNLIKEDNRNQNLIQGENQKQAQGQNDNPKQEDNQEENRNQNLIQEEDKNQNLIQGEIPLQSVGNEQINVNKVAPEEAKKTEEAKKAEDARKALNAKLQSEITDKQSKMSAKHAEGAAKIDAKLEQERTELIRKTLEEERKAKFRSEIADKQSEMSKTHAAGAAKVDAELEQKRTEQIRKTLEEEKKAKIKSEIADKQSEMRDKHAAGAAKIDAKLEQERTELIRKTLEEERKAKFRSEITDKQSEMSVKHAEGAAKADAKLEQERTERIRKQLEHEKMQREIADKQSEMSDKHVEGAAKADAKLEQERTEQIRKQLEHEKMQKEILDAQSKLSPKSATWLKKYDEEQSKQADDRILMAYLIEGYDKLAKGGATVEDAHALRDRMIKRLIEFTGVENEFIEFAPTDKLVEFMRYAMDNQFAEGTGKTLAKQIRDLDDSYTNTEDDTELLNRIKECLDKGNKMTAQDKLLAFDYSALLICMNRSKEAGDIKYNDYLEFDLDFLYKYASEQSDYRATLPDENVEFDELPKEQAAKHRKICSQIISEFTGKDEAYFDVIPLEDLSDYAEKISDIVDKDRSEEAKEKCLKHAEEIYARIKTIDDALAKNDRAGLLTAIDKLAGIKPETLKGFASSELRDILISMYANTSYPETMVQTTDNLVTEYSKLFGADHYKALLHTAHRAVWLKRDLGDAPDFEDLRSMAEYSILYLKEHQGMGDLDFGDFDGLSADEIYGIYRNVGIIEGFKGTTDAYEQNDIIKAIRELSGMAMSDRLKTALQKTYEITLESDPEKQPEYVETEKPSIDLSYAKKSAWKKSGWQTKQEQKEALKKQSIDKRGEFKESEEHKEFMIINESYHRQLDKLYSAKLKKQAAKVETEEDLSYSKETVSLLSIIGDVAMLTGQSALDSGMAQKVKQALSDRADDVAILLNTGSNKMLTASNAFAEIRTGGSDGEKVFFETFENSFMPVIAALREAIAGPKGDQKITKDTVIKALKSGRANEALQAFANSLDENIDIFEKEMLPVMTGAVSDIYNKGDDFAALPEVTELMNDDYKQLLRLVDEENKKDRLAAAKNTKEKRELQKKTTDQAQKERSLLNDMHENLLYDSKKGQGRFNQLLMSGYYINSSKADQRRMLSYVIRDLKKKGSNTTNKEKGCEYFASTMKGAGPLMQKMMQGVPERMVIPELAGALGVVKSSLAHIDPKYVDKVFNEMIKDSDGAITKITERESLGAASVAETFKCKIEGPEVKPHYVVVKILRPDAKENMKKDLGFVRMAAMFADMSDSQMAAYEKKYGKKYVKHDVKVTESGFLAQFSEIEKEFDFTTEAANARLGYDNYIKKYNKKKDGSDNYHVKTVMINENFKPKKHYLVMDMAEGATVDKIISQAKNDYRIAMKTFRNTDPSIRDNMVVNSDNVEQFWKLRNNLLSSANNSIKTEKLCAQLAYVWLEQALFGSKAIGFGDDPNFHHGDMHAGNIMVDGKNTTILDYGNAVILLDSKVNQILSMLSSVVINSSKHFVEAFNNMLILSAKDEEDSADKVGYAPLTAQQQKQFVTKLDELFKLGTAQDTGKKIMIALNVAQSLGVKLPKEIQNFSQCQQRLENTLLETKVGALKTTHMVETMDGMQVADEDADSFDPLIKLHLYHRMRQNRSESRVSVFCERYMYVDHSMLMFEAGKSSTKADLDELIQGYIPMYHKIKDLITAKEARAKVAEWRKTLKEINDIKKSGKNVPHALASKMGDYAGDLMTLGTSTGYFGDVIDEERFLDMLSRSFMPLDGQNFDEKAFEYLAVIMEEYIPTVLENVDAIYDSLAEVSKDENVERTRRSKVAEYANTAAQMKTVCKPECLELRARLRDSKTGEKREAFERHASRLLKGADFKNYYRQYREIESKLDKARESGNKEEESKLEKQLINKENDLLCQFMSDSSELLLRIRKNYDINYDMEEIGQKDFMPDFVEVMSDVVSTHWKRSVGKVNKALAVDIKKLSDEEEKVEKTIKKEEKAEEARKKKEAELLKKKKAEEEKKKKKEEKERLKKEAELKKKQAKEAKKKKKK